MPIVKKEKSFKKMQTQNKYHERNLISINIQEERNLMPKQSDLIGEVILILHEKDKAKLFREGKRGQFG